MPPTEQGNLLQNDEALTSLIMSDKEIEPIKKEITKHMEEVKKLSCNHHCYF